MSRPCVVWVALVFLGSSALASAQTARGAFESQPEGRITPTVAAAYIVRDQFNPRQNQVEVILSTAAVDVAKAVTALAPHTMVINDAALKDTNYVLIWISADGKVSMNATFSKTMTQFVDRASADGALRAELTTNTPDKVAGRIFTPAPIKTMSGSTYSVDLTFSAPVTKAAAGTALPGGRRRAWESVAWFLRRPTEEGLALAQGGAVAGGEREVRQELQRRQRKSRRPARHARVLAAGQGREDHRRQAVG